MKIPTVKEWCKKKYVDPKCDEIIAALNKETERLRTQAKMTPGNAAGLLQQVHAMHQAKLLVEVIKEHNNDE
jgi:hypothetical protein